jgi:hypothetical protein
MLQKILPQGPGDLHTPTRTMQLLFITVSVFTLFWQSLYQGALLDSMFIRTPEDYGFVSNVEHLVDAIANGRIKLAFTSNTSQTYTTIKLGETSLLQKVGIL